MRRPPPFTTEHRIQIAEGVVVSTLDVWAMFEAAIAGDIAAVEALVAKEPAIIDGRYDYTSPLHFAVREGHFELVRYFVERGALDPAYYMHPFKLDLVTMAGDRGFVKIMEYLRKQLAETDLDPNRWDTGKIDYGYDDEQVRFQQAVDKGDREMVRSMLVERRDLAAFDNAFWGEGILAVPANHNDKLMVELLLEYGAAVPETSKWGARYYFKHFEMARFLMEHGMPPNHKNWREFTLLHDMVFTGEVDKAMLLLEHGADVNAIDDELHSTALGWAVYWNRREFVPLLLEFGADLTLAGAEWSTPLAWARKKGFTDIESDLIAP